MKKSSAETKQKSGILKIWPLWMASAHVNLPMHADLQRFWQLQIIGHTLYVISELTLYAFQNNMYSKFHCDCLFLYCFILYFM